MLFLTPLALQNVIPLTPSCRTCSCWAFWYRSKVSVAPAARSSAAHARPEDADPGVHSSPDTGSLFLLTKGFIVSSLTFSFLLRKLPHDNRTQMRSQETAWYAPVAQLITGPCVCGDGPWQMAVLQALLPLPTAYLLQNPCSRAQLCPAPAAHCDSNGSVPSKQEKENRGTQPAAGTGGAKTLGHPVCNTHFCAFITFIML